MTKRDKVIQTAMRLLGTPYIWGGEDLNKGVDCSGFIRGLLYAPGIDLLPKKPDRTAAGIYSFFKKKKVPGPSAGCLVFYSRDVKDKVITHVMLCINGERCIGASGGGPKTTTVEIAKNQGAAVKIKPIHYREYIIGYVDPFMGTEEGEIHA